MSSRNVTAALALMCVACTPAASEDHAAHGRAVAIEVGARGYTPAEVTASPGEELHLVFRRTSDEGCGQQLVFPDLDIRRDLPLDEQVAVDITMPASGALQFTCGMAMYRGAIVVR